MTDNHSPILLTCATCALQSLTREHEEELIKSKYKMHVIGVDEAGRGPLAGPVVAAACAIPFTVGLPGVADSKVLPQERREELFQALTIHDEVKWSM